MISYPNEVNSLGMNGHEYHSQFKECVSWDDQNLKQITRLRLLTDPGYPEWDVSYCHGILNDGTMVKVELPFSSLPKKWGKKRDKNYWDAIKYYANKDGVNIYKLKVYHSLSKLW